MREVVDTHAHLADPAFDADRPAVLERARGAGLTAVISVSEDLAGFQRTLALAREYDLLRPAAGLHPAGADPEEAERVIAAARAARGSLAAIGEVGLDYWKAPDEASRELQRFVLGRFVDLAAELDLPLNVHSRSAGREAIELLLARGATRVQMHAFDGRAASALPGVEAGFFFSIPSSIARSRQKQKLVERLPLACLLLETDSPALAADPRERNEPVAVLEVARAIAALKGVPYEAVLEAMAENTRRLYGPLV